MNLPKPHSSGKVREKVRQVLRDLGDTPDEIAAFLAGQGIRGVRSEPYYCPVAIYLRRVFDARPSVGVVTCHLNDDDVVAMPSAISRFIEDFDLGRYPDLEVMTLEAALQMIAPVSSVLVRVGGAASGCGSPQSLSRMCPSAE